MEAIPPLDLCRAPKKAARKTPDSGDDDDDDYEKEKKEKWVYT
jgi:hypothetical protein